MCYRGLANEFYYILERRSVALRRLHRLRQHAERQPADRAPDDSGQPALLGHRDARRRVPLRSRVDSVARRERPSAAQSAGRSWDIESDPLLAGTKLIAEAWDAAGLYQVGSFIGDTWQEWNGRFRDDVRRFWKGDDGSVRALRAAAARQPGLYGHEEREAEQSINFVTCHDGFTLNDLVSYNQKHNEANGEDNRDGANDNLSWNCGAEGPTDDPAVEALRNRQVKNFIAVLMLAAGTPMLLMGDEVRRTQRGNNNAYCHDNELNWFDWSAARAARGRAPVRQGVCGLQAAPRCRGAR